MTTIAESTTKLNGFLDGIADGLLNNHSGEWSEPDADIKNDQATENWHDNARLLEHTSAGVYVLMYITYTENFEDPNYGGNIGGIRTVYSTGWNSTEDHPSGKTTTTGYDPFSSEVGNERGASFIAYRQNSGQYGHGFWFLNNRTDSYQAEQIDSRTDAANLIDVTWWASVGLNHFTVACYNTADVNRGIAGWQSFEYVDEKFWTDGVEPFAVASGQNRNNHRTALNYGFDWWESNDTGSDLNYARTDPAKWGYINPDADDDTYFFRRVTLYSEGNTPAAFLTAPIYNQQTEGSSGDTVTYDGNTYQLFQEEGAATTTDIAVGLRYD